MFKISATDPDDDVFDPKKVFHTSISRQFALLDMEGVILYCLFFNR